MVAGVSVFRWCQLLILRNIDGEDVVLLSRRVNVGGAAEEDVDLRIVPLRHEAGEGLS